MHLLTHIRALIWLAAFGTAINCHARDVSNRADDLAGAPQQTQTIGQGLPGEAVIAVSRIENSQRRTSDDEQGSWKSPFLAYGSPDSELADRFGHQGYCLVRGNTVTSDFSAPFLCAQLQI